MLRAFIVSPSYVQVMLHVWLKAIIMQDHILVRGFCLDEDLEAFHTNYGNLRGAPIDQSAVQLVLRCAS